MKTYLKEIVSRPIRDSKGMPIPFTPIGDDMGFLETNDPVLINGLNAMIREQRGGVREITSPEELEELKKKAQGREEYRSRARTQFGQPARLAEGSRRIASPATASPPPPDPALSEQVPVGAPIDPAPTIKAARRPRASKGKDALPDALPDTVPVGPIPVSMERELVAT
jgi:hypothetical protein